MRGLPSAIGAMGRLELQHSLYLLPGFEALTITNLIEWLLELIVY